MSEKHLKLKTYEKSTSDKEEALRKAVEMGDTENMSKLLSEGVNPFAVSMMDFWLAFHSLGEDKAYAVKDLLKSAWGETDLD